MMFSLTVAVLWPLSGIADRLHLWAPFTWSACLGAVILSYGRLRGTDLAIPGAELLFLISTVIPGVVLSVLVPSSDVHSFDEFLWNFDGNYGWPELAAGRFIRCHLAGALVCLLVYFALPVVGTVVYLALPNRVVRLRYCLTAALGYSVVLCYRFCPAAGPVFLLRSGFPSLAPVSGIPHRRILPNVVLNAIPSGHVAWALILFLFALMYGSRRLQAGTGVFLLLTAVATLGLGQHYLIDLVLAVPFALGCWRLAHRRARSAALAVALLFAWLVLLRGGVALRFPPALVWMLTAMTVAPLALYRSEPRSALEKGWLRLRDLQNSMGLQKAPRRNYSNANS